MTTIMNLRRTSLLAGPPAHAILLKKSQNLIRSTFVIHALTSRPKTLKNQLRTVRLFTIQVIKLITAVSSREETKNFSKRQIGIGTHCNCVLPCRATDRCILGQRQANHKSQVGRLLLVSISTNH